MKKTPANKLQWATIGAILLGLNLSPSLFAKEANVGEKMAKSMSEALRARMLGICFLLKKKQNR